MKSKNKYFRKISAKEAEKGFIFVLKNKLSFFPKSSFELSDGHLTMNVQVKSYPCTCRGPELPHEHYYISWSGLEVGDIIEIKKNDSDQYKYCINYE